MNSISIQPAFFRFSVPPQPFARFRRKDAGASPTYIAAQSAASCARGRDDGLALESTGRRGPHHRNEPQALNAMFPVPASHSGTMSRQSDSTASAAPKGAAHIDFIQCASSRGCPSEPLNQACDPMKPGLRKSSDAPHKPTIDVESIRPSVPIRELPIAKTPPTPALAIIRRTVFSLCDPAKIFLAIVSSAIRPIRSASAGIISPLHSCEPNQNKLCSTMVAAPNSFQRGPRTCVSRNLRRSGACPRPALPEVRNARQDFANRAAQRAKCLPPGHQASVRFSQSSDNVCTPDDRPLKKRDNQRKRPLGLARSANASSASVQDPVRVSPSSTVTVQHFPRASFVIFAMRRSSHQIRSQTGYGTVIRSLHLTAR